MARSRSRLHINRLDEFASFCVEQGWTIERTKDQYEVLRLRKGREVAIVHGRLSSDNGSPLVHYTTWGASNRLLNQYLASRKA